MAKELTISKMAEHCGLSAHTLRYYERIGLIQSVTRGTDGHRRYSARDVDWIAFINRMKDSGMPIKSMLEFAELRRQGERSFPQRRLMLERHTEVVKAHIQELESTLVVLLDKVDYYRACESSMTSETLDKGSTHGKSNSLHTRSGEAERS